MACLCKTNKTKRLIFNVVYTQTNYPVTVLSDSLKLPYLYTMKAVVVSALLSLMTYSVFGQTQNCGTTVIMDQIRQNQPEVWQRIMDMQQQPLNQARLTDDVYIIPVVVHIVYNTAAQNLDDIRVFTQINVLNEDFRRLNPDTVNTPEPYRDVAADVGIEFCLASIDPDGNPTSGIIRTYTDTTIWNLGYSEKVKKTAEGGDDAWPSSTYLNIWVCNLQDGILGYAVSPGAPADVDGVVVDYKNFGLADVSSQPYHLGRTTTHEIGHWLGLTHVWGDDGGSCAGDDGVSDTPLQANATYGCPDFPLTDDCTIDWPGVLFMNYMDYTDDACMNMFTEGQKERMRSVMLSYRAALLTSIAGCNEIEPIPGNLAEINIYPVPNNGQFTISVKNFAGTLNIMEFAIYNTTGQFIAGSSMESGNNVAQYADLGNLPPGTYVVTVFNGSYFLNKAFIIM